MAIFPGQLQNGSEKRVQALVLKVILSYWVTSSQFPYLSESLFSHPENEDSSSSLSWDCLGIRRTKQEGHQDGLWRTPHLNPVFISQL